MQIQDFINAYRLEGDEELMRLAAAPEQLTAEARLALKGELSRRRISIQKDPSVVGYEIDRDDAGSATSEELQEGEQQGIGDFVAKVLRTYHSHFLLFFKITVPAVIISTIAIVAGGNEGREIARHLPRGFGILAYRTEILEIWLANLSAYLVIWMVFSTSFAAICIAVEATAAGFTPSPWRSIRNVRARLAPFIRLCLLLFVLMLVAVAAAGLLEAGVLWGLDQWHVQPSRLLITGVTFVIMGLGFLLLSRFALAIPAVILDDCRVGQAMFRSDELTHGKWLTLAVLLAKSLIGGYVAAFLPFWLASAVRLSTPVPSWFPWILTGFSIIGVAAVEPTMFVGFALLYLKMTGPSACSKRAARASQMA